MVTSGRTSTLSPKRLCGSVLRDSFLLLEIYRTSRLYRKQSISGDGFTFSHAKPSSSKRNRLLVHLSQRAALHPSDGQASLLQLQARIRDRNDALMDRHYGTLILHRILMSCCAVVTSRRE